MADLTTEARQGYDADANAKNPFLWSSSSWLAFEAGRHLRNTGAPRPIRITASKGHSVRIDDGRLLRYSYDHKRFYRD